MITGQTRFKIHLAAILPRLRAGEITAREASVEMGISMRSVKRYVENAGHVLRAEQ